MKASIYNTEDNYLRNSIQDIEQPDNFHFHYEKQSFKQIDGMSPTSTCPSESKISSWFRCFPDEINQDEQPQENIANNFFGSLSGDFLGRCTQQYTAAVSDYLKDILDDNSDQTIDFTSLKHFSGLDIQKQEFTKVLNKYNKSMKSSNNGEQIFRVQNSVFRSFMEQITYLNYEQINLELIWIVDQVQNFKKNQINQGKTLKEFLISLSQNQSIQYISFKFLQNSFLDNEKQNVYFNFLQKLFQIISKLYLHCQLFQVESDDQPIQPEFVRNQIKLFSSRRDLWESENEDEEIDFSGPCKRIKYSYQ